MRPVPLPAAAALLTASAALAQPCTPEWSALGDGINLGNNLIDALAEFDDGTGSALYAGGSFNAADGAPANGIARWDGASWSGVGGGIGDDDSRVAAMVVFDHGAGPTLTVLGEFQSIGGLPASRVARWNGAGWAEVGGGLGDFDAAALAAFDDGGGPVLYAAGGFSGPEVPGLIARLRDGAWTDVAGGVWGSYFQFGCAEFPVIRALQVFDDGTGGALFVAGRFESAGDVPVNAVAGWNGADWSAAGSPPNVNCPIESLAVLDDGAGPALFAAMQWEGLLRWNGQDWSEVPGSPDSIRTLAVHDDGRGPALYVGGGFTKGGGIARWDGQTWSTLGDGLKREGGNAGVTALLSVGSGAQARLVVAGRFTSAGGRPALNIATWGCPPCLADCDQSGALDLADWLCFVARFNNADLAADCDQSSGLDLFDFLCFVNAFNQGCP